MTTVMLRCLMPSADSEFGTYEWTDTSHLLLEHADHTHDRAELMAALGKLGLPPCTSEVQNIRPHEKTQAKKKVLKAMLTFLVSNRPRLSM